MVSSFLDGECVDFIFSVGKCGEFVPSTFSDDEPVDLDFSKTYSVMKTTDKISSNANNTEKTKRTLEGLLVSGSSSKSKGILAISLFISYYRIMYRSLKTVINYINDIFNKFTGALTKFTCGRPIYSKLLGRTNYLYSEIIISLKLTKHLSKISTKNLFSCNNLHPLKGQ